MSKPTVICLTPVKNEIWILDRFLKCASLWADHIIIADQSSDDGSREIALSYPKVTLIDNPSPTFNEPERQRFLLEAARHIPGPRLLIALDSDEFLTSDFMSSPEWGTIIKAPKGTVICFQMPVILPDLRSYWMPKYTLSIGFMDDGSGHIGRKIHSPRIPIPDQATTITLRDIKIMHYVGVDSEKWKSKHLWYQCWECLNQPQNRPISIYRRYHRNDVVPVNEIKPMPKEWLSGYEQQGIDMTSIHREGFFNTDKQVLEFLIEYGPARFKRIAIWDVDWTKIYERMNHNAPPVDFSDPRSRFDRYIHRWLKKTQPYFSYFDKEQTLFSKFAIRITQRILRLFGW